MSMSNDGRDTDDNLFVSMNIDLFFIKPQMIGLIIGQVVGETIHHGLIKILCNKRNRRNKNKFIPLVCSVTWCLVMRVV